MKLLSLGKRKRAAALDARSAFDAALEPAFVEGRWRVPDAFNFTRDVVEVLAADLKRPALMFLGKDGVIEPRTFHQVAENGARWADHLRAQGARPGDRVLILLGRSPDWVEVMLAAMKVGVVAVPCPESLSAAALDVRIASSGAKLVVAGRTSEAELVQTAERPLVLYVDEFHEAASRFPTEVETHDTSPRDLAFVLSTSGTGGGPRGVMHSHAATFAARVQAAHWLDAGPGDLVWCTADTGSPTAVWNVLLGPWSRGAQIVLHEQPFDAEQRLDLIRRMDVTVLVQSPAEYEALLGIGDRTLRRYRPYRLRRMLSTGDRLRPELISAFEDLWGLTIQDGYGQAETGVIVGHTLGMGFREGSIGLPLPGYDVAIVDDNGNVLPPGGEGEIALRGRPPSLFAGYWDLPEETKASFRGEWYVTGDVGSVDEEGFFWYLGRAHDIITTGGGRFGPHEVEQALLASDSIAEAAVVGIRDLERGGHFVRAFAVLAPKVEGSEGLVAEIREGLREALPDYKVPREIDFVDELPKTAEGKIRRLELRERLVVGPEPMWAPSPAIVEAEARTALRPEPELEPVEPAPAAAAEVLPPVTVPEPEPVPAPEASVAPEPVVTEPPGASEAELEARSEPEPVDEFAVFDSIAAGEPVAEPELEPQPPEAVAQEAIAEPELEPEFEPTAEVVPEPEPAPEPEPPPQPVPIPPPDPEPEDPPPAALVDPEPLPDYIAHEASDYASIPVEAPEPEPVAEPAADEPLPDYIAHEASDYASIPLEAAEPEPEAEPAGEADLPDYVVTDEDGEPHRGPTAVADPDPEPEPDPDPEERNWTVVSTPDGQEEAGPEAPPEEERPTFTSLPDLGRTLDQKGERKKRSRKESAAAKRSRARRSDPEPGEEYQETDWMRGLSSRLSAYTIEENGQDTDEPADSTDEEKQ